MDEIKLPSGAIIVANRGIVGIDAALDVFDGYDGEIYTPAQDEERTDDAEPSLTPQEQVELADVMLERWQAFKARAIEKGPRK